MVADKVVHMDKVHQTLMHSFLQSVPSPGDSTYYLLLLKWPSKLLIYHHSFLFFSQTGSTPLFMACQEGKNDVVNILLANGADVNLTGFQVISDGN